MKHHVLSKFLVLLALLLVAVVPATAQDEDDTETQEIRKIIEEYIAKTIFAPATLDSCLGLSDGVSCKASDVAGFGLNCPQTSSATDSHDCSVETSEEIDASITAFAKKILKISGKFTTIFHMVSSESSVTHNHQTCADQAGACAERYVGRHEIITGLIALYQEGSVSLAPPESLGEVSAYTAAVKAAKGRVIKVSRKHYCSWEDHGEPLTCQKKIEGPITPGGTTTTTGEPGEPGDPGQTGHDGDPGSDETNVCSDGDVVPTEH